eukprot:3023104-Rhodomonas_salina.1
MTESKRHHIRMEVSQSITHTQVSKPSHTPKRANHTHTQGIQTTTRVSQAITHTHTHTHKRAKSHSSLSLRQGPGSVYSVQWTVHGVQWTVDLGLDELEHVWPERVLRGFLQRPPLVLQQRT